MRTNLSGRRRGVVRLVLLNSNQHGVIHIRRDNAVVVLYYKYIYRVQSFFRKYEERAKRLS